MYKVYGHNVCVHVTSRTYRLITVTIILIIHMTRDVIRFDSIFVEARTSVLSSMYRYINVYTLHAHIVHTHASHSAEVYIHTDFNLVNCSNCARPHKRRAAALTLLFNHVQFSVSLPPAICTDPWSGASLPMAAVHSLQQPPSQPSHEAHLHYRPDPFPMIERQVSVREVSFKKDSVLLLL